MPEYLYRREDGSTFTVRQKFTDDALTVDPVTGQNVVRIIQPTGIIFKGSGFYVNDSKDASKKSLSTPANGNGQAADAPVPASSPAGNSKPASESAASGSANSSAATSTSSTTASTPASGSASSAAS